MADFTPGPWKVESPGCLHHYGEMARVVANDGTKITLWKEIEFKKDKADMNLIAAAPDMYEALEWIQQLHANGAFVLKDKDYIVICKVADALAKAEGR